MDKKQDPHTCRLHETPDGKTHRLKVKGWKRYFMKMETKKEEAGIAILYQTTWIDLEGIMLSEIIQRKTNTVSFHLCVESKKLNK